MKKKLVGALLAVAFTLTAVPAMALATETEESNPSLNNQFTDVPSTAWYYDCVMQVAEKGLMIGVESDRFDPARTLTRAEFATILYRFADGAKLSSNIAFNDVASDMWYSDAINWAVSSGYMSGVGDNYFQPSEVITREQVAIVLWNFIYYYDGLYQLSAPFGLENYSDYVEISTWAQDAVSNIAGNGIMQGTSENGFSPKKGLTRAETAAVFVNLISFFNNKGQIDYAKPVSSAPAGSESAGIGIAAGHENKIVLFWSGRFPPLSQDDDTELYFAETVFLPDGTVEYTGYSYNRTVLENEAWQVKSENYEELVDILTETGFFSLPQQFVYGGFDESANILRVYADGEYFFSNYGPSHDSEEDKESYLILSACVDAFKEKTSR